MLQLIMLTAFSKNYYLRRNKAFPVPILLNILRIDLFLQINNSDLHNFAEKITTFLKTYKISYKHGVFHLGISYHGLEII